MSTNIFVFQDLFSRIDRLLANFAVEKSQAIAVMLDPTVTLALGIAAILYGVAHMLGKIDEPITAMLERFLRVTLILAAAFGAGSYNDIVIQTFQDSPLALAAALSGTTNTATTLSGMGVVLDEMVGHVVNIASTFFHMAGITDLYPLVLAVLVIVVGIPLTIGAGALIAFSKVASALILGLGPLFILALLFETTKNYFSSYVNMLIQYGLVGALAVGANSLVLSMFQQVAASIDAMTGMATLNEIAALLVTGGIGILTLWQVPNMASGLAGGLALSTFGVGRKIAGGAFNKVTNKEGRDNQRAARRQIDVEKRVDALKERKTPRPERANNQVSRSRAA